MHGGERIALGGVGVDRRSASDGGTIRNVPDDSRLGQRLDLIADLQMACDTGLSTQCDVVTDFDRSRDAHERDEQTVLADRGAVTDRDEIGELGSSPHDRFAQGGPLDGAVGSDLDVVFKDRDARLGNLVVGTGMRGVSKAVISDRGTGMHGDPVAQTTAVVDRDIGVEDAVISDLDIRTDIDTGVEVAARSDPSTRFDGDMGVDPGAFSDRGIRMNGGQARNTVSTILDDRRMNPVAMKEDHGIAEPEIGVFADQSVEALRGGIRLPDEHSGRLGGGQVGLVLGIRQESDFFRAGFADAGASFHFDLAVPMKDAIDLLSQF